MTRSWEAVGGYLSDSWSRADSVSLADSLGSCWFARTWLIRGNLAEFYNAGWLLWGRLLFNSFGWCNAGISRGYIMERKFESFRGPGRCLSNGLVQSGISSRLLAANERRERERNDGRTKGRAGLALWRCEDVASRPKRERKFYGLHAKRLMLYND